MDITSCDAFENDEKKNLTYWDYNFFAFNFKDHVVSSKINEWGSFGDFFGGILISFISLIVLSYLIYLVGKQSSIENKKVNILLRKFDAYDKLTSYSPGLNTFAEEILRKSDLFHKELTSAESLNSNDLLIAKKEYIKSLQWYSEFHYFLFSFNLRFSHLFKYDFKNPKFESLLEISGKMQDYMDTAIQVIESEKIQSLEMPDFKSLVDLLLELINSLRLELK